MKKPVIDETAVVLPGAVVVGDVTVGADSCIWYNTVVRGDLSAIVIGQRTNVQDNSVLHTDPDDVLQLGDDVTIGHACILHGCKIRDGVLVGQGSIVMNGAVLEEGCMVGAGSLVTQNAVIPAGMLAFGRPAKPVRPLTAQEIAHNRQHAVNYVATAKLHQQG